jgi:predicted DNA repair protein MutK
MASGLLALLDDIAAIAKVAAASLDDVAAQAAKAGTKAAGVVIDDAAVTPRYVVGFAADRELPIVWRIAVGSLKNKLLFLLPGALALSLFAPWAITPLLMAGGLFLCFEGYEKVHHLLKPADHGETSDEAAPESAAALEEARVTGAIRTDFILSAEIMAITLASVATLAFWNKALVLGLVGAGITCVVYGAVALIVKADDIGVALAKGGRLGLTRALGRALVKGVPPFLSALSAVGTAAMVWVGGGIIVHGLAGYGFAAPEHVLHALGSSLAGLIPAGGGFLGWLGEAAGAGVIGLAVGAVVAFVVGLVGKVRGGHPNGA